MNGKYDKFIFYMAVFLSIQMVIIVIVECIKCKLVERNYVIPIQCLYSSLPLHYWNPTHFFVLYTFIKWNWMLKKRLNKTKEWLFFSPTHNAQYDYWWFNSSQTKDDVQQISRPYLKMSLRTGTIIYGFEWAGIFGLWISKTINTLDSAKWRLSDHLTNKKTEPFSPALRVCVL